MPQLLVQYEQIWAFLDVYRIPSAIPKGKYGHVRIGQCQNWKGFKFGKLPESKSLENHTQVVNSSDNFRLGIVLTLSDHDIFF